MDISPILGTCGSMVARAIVAQSYHLKDKTALLYNSVDMIVSYLAKKILAEHISEYGPLLIASRLFGFIAATGTFLAMNKQVDPVIALAMSIAGFVTGFLLETSAKKDPNLPSPLFV